VNTSSYSYGTSMGSSRTSSSLSSKGPESSPSMEANLFMGLKNVQSMTSDYNGQVIKQLEAVYGGFVKLDGKNGKTLFIIGFLLIQEAISQKSMEERNRLINYVLESSTALIQLAKIQPNEKSLLKSFKAKIQDFFQTTLRKKDELFPALNERGGAGKYLCEHMKIDKDFGAAIIQVGRWVIVDIMTRSNMITQKRGLYGKFTEKGWEIEDLYSKDILDIFISATDFKIVVVNVRLGKMKENISNPNGKYEGYILDYASPTKDLKAILYKESDFPPQPFSEQESILSRKERPINKMPSQSEMVGNGSQHPGYPSLSQARELTEVSQPQDHSRQKCKECSICHIEIMDNLIFTNEFCRHNYCLYCIQEAGEPNVSLCYLKICPARLDKHELKRFIQTCAKLDGGEKPTSLNMVPEEGSIINQPQNFPNFSDRNTMMLDSQRLNSSTNLSSSRMNTSGKLSTVGDLQRERMNTCSMCTMELSEKNPCFVNKACNHAFCAAWLKANNPVFSGSCFMSRCYQEFNFDQFRDFLVQNNITNIKIRCDICSVANDVAKSFVNSRCNHKICLNCTEKLRSTWCPKSNCREMLNEERLSTFRESLILQEENKHLSKMVVTCKLCRDQAEIYSSDKSKSDYWKCQKCSATHCMKHDDLMSNCFCNCPGCLSNLIEDRSIQSQYCGKCIISYCMKCKKEHKGRTACPCIEEEPLVQSTSLGSMSTAMIKSTNSTMNSSQKRKQQENICSLCYDFRDHPEFLKLKCGHKICEYCIILKRKDYSINNKITCTICRS